MTRSTLSTWQQVVNDAELLARAATCDPADVASISRLRKKHTQDHVAVVLELVKARSKAKVKFDQHADQLIADVPGVEQASSLAVAMHKAQRFVRGGFSQVTDLCCGIGGDAMGFVQAGLTVSAIDRDPLRSWMAGQNAACDSRVAIAEDLAKHGHTTNTNDTALHLDPARRSDAGRVFRLADHLPGPDTIRKLIAAYPNAAVKLSPAVNLNDLDDTILAPMQDTHDGFGDELEFISEAGRLVQTMLWTGRLAQHLRSATLLSRDGHTHTLAGDPDETDFTDAQRYLFTVDSSVERAGLMHLLDLPAIHPKLGLLTASSLDDVADESRPWLTAFELLAELPHRPKKIKAWLDDHDGGLVEVKTRGKAVDPDAMQQQLRGAGSTPYTVFILRFDQRVLALVTRRVAWT